ncbi:MAG: class I SAM-dependent rRNA methyltransferase [Planctomycetes bacterium]|nr:class I SAM-dependent rRNA methyltransferase [Planctomycetota bacterium]
MPASCPVGILVPKQTHRCLNGHLWVFRSELDGFDTEPEAGQLVELRDRRNNLVGKGFYSATSQIAVRLLTRRPIAVDEEFLRARLRLAIARRTEIMAGRPARRLVSSEGDLLPGLIVDQYADRLVIQTTTAGMDQRQRLWLDLLVSELAPRQVVERNDLHVRNLEGLQGRAGVLLGSSDTSLTINIGKAAVDCDLLDPHKTGTYLDQQLNHEAIARWVRPGDRVLDCFCHLGGFAIHALLAGAGSAVAVDQSEGSIAGTVRCAARAGVGDRLTTSVGNAFDWLRQADLARERFDVVVLDPPSFTRNRASVPQAMAGYKEIHLRGLRRLAPGGRLLTFTCSHHIDARSFLDMVLDAASDARRTLRLEAVLGASPDHPVLPAVPESEYLKGFVFTVVDD